MARYRSSPAVSQIWALMVRPFSCTVLVLNSTPMVVRLSWLNSFLVNRDSKLLLPTPDSPIRTTATKQNPLCNWLQCHVCCLGLLWQVTLQQQHKDETCSIQSQICILITKLSCCLLQLKTGAGLILIFCQNKPTVDEQYVPVQHSLWKPK